MSNFYKKLKLAFRGNFPLWSDQPKDPYNPHSDGYDVELNTPGDNSTSGFGTDYYVDRKPPVSSVKPEYATRPKWNGDFDGEDPDENDHKPAMNSGDAFYDSDSPIGIQQEVARSTNKVDRDNTAIGPFNQSLRKTHVFFDSIKRRLNN